MNSITNRISTILSIVTSDMPIYVAGDDKLYGDIKRGWEKRDVSLVSVNMQTLDKRGLLIIDDDTFFIKY